MPKRRRIGRRAVYQTSKKRPLDKNIINISQIYGIGGGQINTQLYGTSFPGTVTGLRWQLNFQNGTGATGNIMYAIVISRDGVLPSVLANTSGAPMYKPEQQVIAIGEMALENTGSTAGPSLRGIEGQTKSMRKLQNGDALFFIARTDAAIQALVTGVVQFFIKS